MGNQPINNTGLNESDSDNNSNGGGSNIGAIVGGVVGGVVFLGLLIFGAVLWKRKKKSQEDAAYEYSKTHPFPRPDATVPVPFDMSQSSSNFAQLPTVNSKVTSNYQDVGVVNQRSDNQRWRPRREGLSQDQWGHFSSPTLPTTSSVPAKGLPPISHSSIPRCTSVPNMPVVSSYPYSAAAGDTGVDSELRAEVEQLRREIETIRVMAEPPPGYN